MPSTRAIVMHVLRIAVMFALYDIATVCGKQIQCSVSSSKDLFSALHNPACKGIKFRDFILSTNTLRNAFFKSTTQHADLETNVYESVVFSGTKLEPGAMFVLGDILSQGLLKTKSLIFWNNGLDCSLEDTSEAVIALIQVLDNATSVAPTYLRELHFSDNLLHDHCTESLAAAVAASQIHSLVLSGNGIQPAGIASMCDALVKSHQLEALTITGAEGGSNQWMSNHVGLEGARGLQTLLISPSSKVSKLVLSGTNLKDEGAVAIGQALTDSREIKILDLNRNSITDVGAKGLAEGIRGAASLNIVILATNKISDEGAGELARAVHHHNNIIVVDLENNAGTTRQAKDLVAAVRPTCSIILCTIDLTCASREMCMPSCSDCYCNWH
eukprot:m.90467 g.90467  ORF g.90467 m.90467 type:complete len:386 (+) comp16458_c0_seq4:141-1298(+)